MPRTLILNDVLDIITFIKNNRERFKKEVPFQPDTDQEFERYRYLSLSKDVDGDKYFVDVRICKILYYDILNGTNLHRLKRYVPGIDKVKIDEVRKIYFDKECEEYVIRTKDNELRLYKENLTYIYPYFCMIRDPEEFELVYDNGRVFTYSKFDDSFRVPVYE